jgi:hypothetical protein
MRTLLNVAVACLFAFWAGHALSGCWVCSQTVRFDCTHLGLQKVDGQCMFVQVHWNCDFRGGKKKYGCRFQRNSDCPVTPDCGGVCEHTFGTAACHEEGLPGC